VVLKRVKVRGKREMKEEGWDVSNRMAAEGLKPNSCVSIQTTRASPSPFALKLSAEVRSEAGYHHSDIYGLVE